VVNRLRGARAARRRPSVTVACGEEPLGGAPGPARPQRRGRARREAGSDPPSSRGSARRRAGAGAPGRVQRVHRSLRERPRPSTSRAGSRCPPGASAAPGWSGR